MWAARRAEALKRSGGSWEGPPEAEGGGGRHGRNSDMLAADEFLRSPPKKTVRFGGALDEILQKYKKGETTDFDLLKHQLLDPDIKDDQIINWLHEFRASVTQLTKDFEQLVNILLKVPWLRRSQAVVEEYLSFLGNLVSAQTIYLRPCLAMIVSHFVPPRIIIQENDVDISDSDDDENVPEAFDTCHRALQTIVKYVPLTPQFLMPVLTEKFPFINKSERTLQCYVHNMLRISGYISTLRRDILELVIERLLKMDVSAPRKDIETAEAMSEETTEEGLFDMDEDEEKAKRNEMMAHPIAERLDILMMMMFSYVKDICHVNGKLDTGNTKNLYRDLVAVFDKLILPTHGSCHVQYVMFYLCSLKWVIAEVFVEHLWKKIQNPNTPAVIRQAAGNYIGSFLARAKFIPVMTVKACLKLLVDWLHLYIDSQDSGGSKAFCDVAIHGPFYTACQAVFYVLIFRHKQILDGNLKKGLAFLQNFNFERIIMSQLNPLKVCLPSIVNFFAAFTRKYQIAFCDTIIERNRRQVLPVVRSSCGGDSVETCTNPLDSFFPFDPYILKRSQNIINPLYQFWEEESAEDLGEAAGVANESKGEEEDDFLKGETPQNDGMMVGVTPSSFDSSLQSPGTCIGLQVSPELPSEMFPSSSQACCSTKNGCVPFGSYFSFSGTGDPENLRLPQGKPWGDSPYSGGFLQDAPPGVDALDVFTHPKGAQKPQKRRIPMKTRRSPKNTLVLELFHCTLQEGILAVSSLTAPWNDAPKFITSFQDSCYQVSFKLRPHIHEFLQTLAKSYEVFVFTTAKQDYADKILEALGPHRKLIRHELYQEDCMCWHGSYVKDLSVLERDLGKTVAVATHRQAFPSQTSSVLVLPPWLGNAQDEELLGLIPVLEKLSQAVDVRAEIEMIMTK